MVIYKITAIPRNDLKEKFIEYMEGAHIPDMKRTGFFVSAEMVATDQGVFEIEYTAAGKKELDEYLRTCAQKLREDFLRHFPEGVEIRRSIIAT